MAEPGKDRDPPRPTPGRPPNTPWTPATRRPLRRRDAPARQPIPPAHGQARPNVLSMEYELVLDGREFPARSTTACYASRRPRASKPTRSSAPSVVDPRAGHGPGIGGFKPESEIGVALRAGHACYFATFLPQPMPTQTVEDVIQAEARFWKRSSPAIPTRKASPWWWPIAGRLADHDDRRRASRAVRPHHRGRRAAVLLGGLARHESHALFRRPAGRQLAHRAHQRHRQRQVRRRRLVQNFENLNPANTLWSKQYNLYSKVDTEAERYLSFEKWWGGHVFLNGTEIQYIVDKLFVGNRRPRPGWSRPTASASTCATSARPSWCSAPRATTSRRRRRWAGSQTFIRTTPKCWPMARPSSTPCTSIGHLGIFVSGSVARKEHRIHIQHRHDRCAASWHLPAEIADKTPDTPNADRPRATMYCRSRNATGRRARHRRPQGRR